MLTRPPRFVYLLGIAFLQQFRRKLLESDQHQIIALFSGLSNQIDIEKCLSSASLLLAGVPESVCHPTDSLRAPEVAAQTRSPPILISDILQRQDCVIVDLRDSQSYSQWKVQGTVNLPISVTEATATIPKIKLAESQLQKLRGITKGKMVVLVGDATRKQNSVLIM